MAATQPSDNLLVERIGQSDPEAWQHLIDRYEGRLLAFVKSRLPGSAAAEDVVQETFIGFLTSLPNYDRGRALESYLFSIAVHKLTDHLRREGRRPTLPLTPAGETSSRWEPPARARAVSSMLRSGERRHWEETALVRALAEQIDHWRRHGQWERLKCAELLFLRGWTNKEAAAELGLSEQTVANCKFEFLARLRSSVRRQDLPEDLFPELYETP